MPVAMNLADFYNPVASAGIGNWGDGSKYAEWSDGWDDHDG